MKRVSYNFGAIQYQGNMRGLLIILWVLTVQAASGQSLDMVELGNLVGEMKAYQSSLSWTNTTRDTLWVSPWADRNELSFEVKSKRLAPGEQLVMDYQLDLTSQTGKQQFEARLVTQDEVVMHGWLLKTRIFEAEEDVFKEYRNEYFPFRTKTEILNLKSVFLGDPLQGSFSLYNFGGQELELAGAYTSQPGVRVSFGPEKVGHNAFTRLTVHMETKEAALGFTRERFSVFTSDSSLLFTIPLQYTLENRPMGMSTRAVPHLTLSKLTHDFKVMEKGTREQVDIRLTNTGNAPLWIEKLESNCTCLEYEMVPQELEAGQSVVLSVTFNATNRKGYERKTLALFTNDPDQPTKVITFKAHVK